jgi:hypothetical protein
MRFSLTGPSQEDAFVSATTEKGARQDLPGASFYGFSQNHVIPAKAGIQERSGFRIESGMTILLLRKRIVLRSTVQHASV